MRTTFVLLCLAGLAVVGCGEKADTGSAKSGEKSGSPLTAPADYVGAVVKAQQTATKVADTASISKAIQMFSVEQGRYPITLDELVEEKYLPRLPDAPQGMRYDYSSNTGIIKVVPSQ